MPLFKSEFFIKFWVTVIYMQTNEDVSLKLEIIVHYQMYSRMKEDLYKLHNPAMYFDWIIALLNIENLKLYSLYTISLY